MCGDGEDAASLIGVLLSKHSTEATVSQPTGTSIERRKKLVNTIFYEAVAGRIKADIRQWRVVEMRD
jgi:hypothetical protein